MKNLVIDNIKKIIGEENIILEIPKDKSMGHFSTPIAFVLAKKLKKSPMVIAQDLSSKLQDLDIFQSVEAVKGFINFRLSLNFIDTFANKILQDEDSFGKSNNTQKILLEYVSANPTGPLHIGHARGAIVGDILATIGKHLGYKITTEYYVNDAGNQIDLLGISLQLSYRENIKKEEVIYPKSYYRGEYIADLADELYNEFGKDIFLQNNFDKLCNIAKDKMLLLIKQNLKDIGIGFDNFISEKLLYKDKDDVLDRLVKSGKTYTKDGKMWLKSTDFKDELDRVIVRENGIPTYLAGDIIYHDNKFKRDFDAYINIWGADHHGYIKRVMASLNFLGWDEKKLEIILAQMVALLKDAQPYKMSKRAGNFILLSDVVEDIGSDALRFVFASKKIDTHLEFDVSELSKEDSTNPIFYINYAHARINSLIEKSNFTLKDIENTKFKDLNEDAIRLLFEALLLPYVLEDTFKNRAVQKLTEFLKSLSAMIHSFYNSTKIINSANEAELLKLLNISAVSLRVGLKLLGITAKYKM